MISVEKRDKINVVTFDIDNLNALVSDDIRERIAKIFETGNSKVIIDLSGIKYIDSSGFGSFLSIMRTARNNYGVLKFANTEPSVMEVFRTLHLNTVFEMYDTVEDCIISMK